MKMALMLGAVLVTVTASAVYSKPNYAVPRTEVVGYADLDLASKSGKMALTQRLRAASGRVCDMGGMQTLEEFAIVSRCYSAALKDGERQMDRVVAGNKSGSMLTEAALTITANR
jgi:UrcA family protein